MDGKFERLLCLVPRRGKLSTPEIHKRLEANGHNVTVRTVQRDLERLEQKLPIDCDRRSPPYGWSWREEAQQLSVLDMDWPEAVSFQLMATYLDGVLPASVTERLQPYVDKARSKLAQHFHDLPLRKWPDRVRIIPPGPAFVMPKIPRAVHETLTEAVLLGRQVRITYRRFEQENGKQYVVSPLGLVQFGLGFYLPVRYDGYEDVRTIKLHRVQRAELLDTPSGIDEFDLNAWIESGALGFGGNERIQLVARLFDGAAEWVQEAPLSRDQQLVAEGDGVYRLKASVMLTVQLRRWLMGLGSRIEIVRPRTLRNELACEIRRMADRYTSGPAAQTAPDTANTMTTQ